jgi:phage-related baseplate assembly protein
MPNFESPALFIDFSRLPPPDVIEEIDYEELLATYRAEVLDRNPALERALKLEQSAANIILEAEAYGEMIVRARVNAGARAVMLAFSTGTDLDNLAAFFNVERMSIPGDNTVDPIIPAVIESDEALRRRTQLAPEALTTAGSEGAYIFQALSADVNLRDASAVCTDKFGNVKVTVMRNGSDPVPTEEQINAVFLRLHRKNIKPLTDIVSVAPVTVQTVDLVANVALYPGPDAALVMADIEKAIIKIRNRISLIGRDLTSASLISALYQEGVQDVDIISPVGDVVAGSDGCVILKSATINVLPNRAE